MVTKKIYNIVCFIVLIIPVLGLGSDRNNLPVTTGWIDLSISNFSDDGRWAIIHQNQHDILQSFLIDVHTKEKKEISGMDYIDVYKNKLIHLDNNKNLSVLDVKLKVNKGLGKCRKINILRDFEAICYIEDFTNKFVITKLKNLKRVIAINDIKDYFINEEKSHIIFLKKTDVYNLYQLDLNTLKETKICEIQNNNIQVIWNTSIAQAAVLLSSNEVLLIDLDKNKYQLIILEENTIVTLNTRVIFLSNNDLYVDYQIQSKKAFDKTDNFVDIWYSNDKKLETKMIANTEYLLTSKQKIYSQIDKRIVDIELDKNMSPIIINNPRKILFYNPFVYNDYTSYIPKVAVNILDLYNQEKTLLADSISTISKNLSYSPNGNFVSYIFKNELVVKNLNTNENHKLDLILDPEEILWSSDSNSMLIINKNAIWLYDLVYKKMSNILQLSGEEYKISFLNKKSIVNGTYQGFGVFPNYIDLNVSPLIHIINFKDNENSIYKITEANKALLLYKTENKLSEIHWNKNLQTIVFKEENFNLPPTVKVINKGILSDLFVNKTSENLYNWRKQKILHFTDKFNVSLKGILYYPKHFDSTKKYPMITKIYEKQFLLANTFYKASIFSNNGFNIPILNELGYFVYLPDTYISEEGPGVSALNCVIDGVNAAINKVENIDNNNLGLLGSSFGGYETNFIVSQTNLFGAAVSGAAINDIIWHYYSYNYDYPKPTYWRFENGQYQINKSFAQGSDLYINNNPLYHAHKIKTPILSFTGLEDRNVPWEHTRHFYIALKRYDIPHIALFYKNNDHVITTPEATKDLTQRIIHWFDYHLKNNKEIEWINHNLYDN